MGSEIESAPLSGKVPPNILVRTEFLENLIKDSSVLFQNTSENSLESYVEMFSDSSNIVELSIDISNENTCEKPSEPQSSFDANPTTTKQTMVK